MVRYSLNETTRLAEPLGHMIVRSLLGVSILAWVALALGADGNQVRSTFDKGYRFISATRAQVDLFLQVSNLYKGQRRLHGALPFRRSNIPSGLSCPLLEVAP